MFTPVHTSLGALLLFNGSFGLLIHNGEVFGISSILSGSVFQPSLKTLPIVAGLVSSLGTVYLATPSLRPNYPDAPSSWKSAALTLGLGLLVGWGTKVNASRRKRKAAQLTNGTEWQGLHLRPYALWPVSSLATITDCNFFVLFDRRSNCQCHAVGIQLQYHSAL